MRNKLALSAALAMSITSGAQAAECRTIQKIPLPEAYANSDIAADFYLACQHTEGPHIHTLIGDHEIPYKLCKSTRSNMIYWLMIEKLTERGYRFCEGEYPDSKNGKRKKFPPDIAVQESE